MKIVIDFQGGQTESRFRGIGRYSTSLARAMIARAGSHDIYIALNAQLEESIQPARDSFADVLPANRIVEFQTPYPTAWPALRNRWRRSTATTMREAFFASLNPDIVHISSLFEGAQDGANVSIGRFDTQMPVAVTLYDLIPLLNKADYLAADWAHDWYMDRVDSLHKAKLLLSISEHARQEAIGALDLDPDRIVNMSSAVSDFFHPRPFGDAERALLRKRFGLDGAYLMYSGAMESRKNVDRLLEAFAVLPRDVRGRHQLVVAGKINDLDRARVQQLASRIGIADSLVLTGYITDAELIALYGGCSLYVFPSLHEGFGLPALEAMSCGVPTIGSSTTSVPEVIGRADALFDPTNVAEMAAVMARGLGDADFNRSLREHAPLQAAKFSWDESARHALDAFEAVHDRSLSRPTVSWGEAIQHHNAVYHRLVGAIADSVVASDEGEVIDYDLYAASAAVAANQHVAENVIRGGELPVRLTWRVEGPFDSSYSLALLNRETARALRELGHDVALHSTEGPGDFEPNLDYLAANSDLREMHARAGEVAPLCADVSSRILYPPRVADMHSRVNMLHHYAWEESGFPHEWVDEFNDSLQAMTCLSTHVEKIMVDAGVSVPMRFSGCGVDHWERVEAVPSYPLAAKTFRFLHVSSCFPRKGADALLAAYGMAFTSDDDVSLVIKTFANPHNRIHEWVADARAAHINFPDVVIIEDDLSDGELKALYGHCDVLVAPSRAEGFGLPMAEAMLSGLGVITTRWGGQLDFCNDETAWLVDFSFARAQTHFNLFNSVWAEPERDDLAATLRKAYACPPDQRGAMVARGKALLQERFTWKSVAQRLELAARDAARAPVQPAGRIGWVTSWNTPCGIATYSHHLVTGLLAPVTILAGNTATPLGEDEAHVHRCWNNGGPDDLRELCVVIDAEALDVVVVQFQYGFFDFGPFVSFLETQLAAGRVVVVAMHSTRDAPETPYKRLADLAPVLSRVDRVLVHAVGDLNRLKAHGLVDNVALFPHGVVEMPTPAHRDPAPTFALASYGFFLPHKGLLQLVEAVGLLVARGKKVSLRMVNAEYPNPVSGQVIKEVQDAIRRLKLQDVVTMVTDYLSDDDSFKELSAADLLLFPYQQTGESSSAAVRYGLAASSMVATTPIPIFDDVQGAVYPLPGTSPQDIADGIATIMDAGADDKETLALRERTHQWRQSHGYSRLSRRMENMLGQLFVRKGLTKEENACL